MSEEKVEETFTLHGRYSETMTRQQFLDKYGFVPGESGKIYWELPSPPPKTQPSSKSPPKIIKPFNQLQ